MLGSWNATSNALMSPKASWKPAISMLISSHSWGRMASSTACPSSWLAMSGLSAV
jgi:hypothetical protein